MIRNILATLVFAVMSSALVGALVYRWQEDRFNALMRMERDLYKSDILDTERQLADCSTTLAEFGWPGTETGAVACGELNVDPQDAKVAFYEESRGIAFAIPYNESWGYGVRNPEPYIRLSGVDGMLFGPPQEIDECAWAHTMQLTFLPRRSKDEIYEDVLERNASRVEAGEVTEEDSAPENHLINNEYDASPMVYHAYRYVVPGNCLLVNYELPGPQYNYVFSACEEYGEALIQVIESVELSSIDS